MHRSKKFSLRLCASASLLTFAVSAAAQTPGPVWAKPDLFWYSKAVPGGNVWMQVDVRNGWQSELFDHTRLAAELSVKMESPIRALALPFASRDAHFIVKFDGGNTMNSGTMALEFVRNGELWRCDMQTEWDWGRASDYDCANRGAFDRVDDPPGDSVPRVSPDGKWAAIVVNNNVVVRRAGTTATTVLSKDGTPTFAYYAGSLAWSADSRTLSAYRVNAAIWTNLDLGASVKQFLMKAEWPVR
jgi:hypothetical protein